MKITQYQVVIVNLDPTIGSEIKKTRPCVVVSPDEMNKHLKTIIIAPLTSASKDYPTRIKVNYQKKEGWVVIDQICTIDKARIIKVTEKLSNEEIQRIKQILKETLVDWIYLHEVFYGGQLQMQQIFIKLRQIIFAYEKSITL